MKGPRRTRRIIDGKIFNYIGYHLTRSEAQAEATKLRKKGRHVRIIPGENPMGPGKVYGMYSR